MANKKTNEEKGFKYDPPYIPKGYKNKDYLKQYFIEWKKFALDHGFEIIDEVYKNGDTKLTFKRISDDKELPMTIAALKQNGWPNIDTKSWDGKQKSKEEHYKEIEEIVEKRGGKLITKEYTTTHSEIIVLTQYGKQYHTDASRLKLGRWSSEETTCAEELCRQVFEHIFKINFPNINDIVKREGKPNLQLDGYSDIVIINNKNYKLAFEYQGHSNHREDKDTMERDRQKAEFCKNNNIILILIDPLHDKNRYDNDYLYNTVMEYIKKEFIKHNINFNFHDKKATFKMNLKVIPFNIKRLEEMRKLGDKSGFELLSEEYKDTGISLKWKNKKTGLEFDRTPDMILYETGWGIYEKYYDSMTPLKDSYNNKERKKSYFDGIKNNQYTKIKKIIEDNGGTIITTTYEKQTDKIEFYDKNNKKLTLQAMTILKGNWIT